MPRTLLALLLPATLLVAACGGPETFENPTGTITVAPGDEFQLEFVINPGVGTNWLLDEEPPSGAPVSYSGFKTEEESEGEGNNVFKRFQLKAEKSGAAELNFSKDYRGEEIQERRTVRIEVNE
jgi:hypothetical protein